MTQIRSVEAVAARPLDRPWQEELAEVERRLRNEMRAISGSGDAARSFAAAAGGDEEALLRRVQALVQESERRQQNELALRIGEALRDISAQRQADLVRIDRSIGVLERNTGAEVMRQGEMLNYLVRTAQTR
jgi:hypothetical protein